VTKHKFRENSSAFLKGTLQNLLPEAEQIRSQLNKKENIPPYLTPFIVELIQRIASYEASKARNAIIKKIISGYYFGLCLPWLVLKTHLNEAGCPDLAESVVKEKNHDHLLISSVKEEEEIRRNTPNSMKHFYS
jgi:hypothetical protein